MIDEASENQSFKLADDRQLRIYERLQLVGEGAPAYFRDACRLISMRPPRETFQTTTHLVGHLIREIESSLRAVLVVVADNAVQPATSGQAQDRQPLMKKGSADPPELELTNGESHKQQIRRILKGLEIPEDHPIASLWIKNSRILAHEWAHRDNLKSPRPVGSDFLVFVDQMESIFDFILSSMETKYTYFHASLDTKLSIDKPTREDAKWIKQSIPNNRAALGYFFNNLKNPRWLWPLKSEGFFTRPPEPQVDLEKRHTTFPAWPASSWLVRMATLETEEVKSKVGEILLSIETSNLVVHLDILDAICELPLDLVAPIADRERAWLENDNPFFDTLIADKVANLVSHLAISGDIERALAINQIALGFIPDTGETDEIKKFFVEPNARLERWEYGQFVAKTWSSLAKSDWSATLKGYCDLLQQYLNLQYPSGRESGNSHSSSWLDTVESDREESVHRLISAIRGTSELVLANDISFLSQVVEILKSYKWDVFYRIVLHLLRTFCKQADDEIDTHLMVVDTFRDPNLFREYSLLLSGFFGKLSNNQQNTILGWIDTYVPSIEAVRDRAKRWRGAEISEEEAEWEIRAAKLRWLHVLNKEDLPEKWRLKYERWINHLGAPPVHFAGVQTSWVAEPAIPEMLVKLSSPERILDYLAGDLNETDSPNDLSREFSNLVSKNPGSYIAISERFHELESRYARAFFSGVRASTEFIPRASWQPLLAAMLKFLDEHGDDESEDWSDVRSIIGKIISSQLSNEEVRIPFVLRFQVWSIIEILTNDPNPTKEYEAQYGGKNMDPLTLSLNTVRGEAFHTLFKYINWCRRELDVQDRTLVSTAEALVVLEKHLKPVIDSSLAVRAVYGERLPSLVAFDPEWVKAHLGEIFPLDKEQASLYKSAWETFITWTRPYDNVFELLEEQYRRGIEHIHDEPLYRSEGPAARLSEHLVVFYARSIIELDGGSVLQSFYETANGAQAAHVFWFIARIVRESAVPPEVLQRLIVLIEQRVKNGTQDERTAFGWVFSSGHFDAEWSLELLSEAAAFTRKLNPDHSVMERLAELSEQFPNRSIEVATHLVDGADTEWKLQYWTPQLRTIIAAAIAQGELGSAVVLVNKLAAKNLPDFRNLLSSIGHVDHSTAP